MSRRALFQSFTIEADQASLENDYLCTECMQPVRLKAGNKRSAHFYHLDPKSPCRLRAKSLKHMAIQDQIKRLLGTGATLEQRFPSINRITDVCWEPKKIVFEVQCSSILLSEVKERNQDYKKAGYRPVWILSDRKFNQRTPTRAEIYLRRGIAFFSNIDRDGRGIIYDQVDVIKRGRRTFKSRPLPVQINQPFYQGPRLNFRGNVFDRESRSPRFKDFASEVKKAHRASFNPSLSKTRRLLRTLIVIHDNWLDRLVERYADY